MGFRLKGVAALGEQFYPIATPDCYPILGAKAQTIKVF